MQSAILIQGFALSRSRSAIQGFALSRSRSAIQGFALPRSRSATQGFALSRSRSARARLESALGERISAPFTDIERRVLETVPTGIAPLDALTGGLPRGAITELFGPPSSGRTSTMISILAEATARDEVCALVDGNDAFDPKFAAAAGIDLNRLLWVRCRKLEHVLKTTDLLLQGGGFGRVVMDLTDLPRSHVRSIPLASWFRFQRTIERTPTVLVVMSPESIVKSAAALVLQMEMQGLIVRSRKFGVRRVNSLFCTSKIGNSPV